jgi:tetratricopeptide (TPR) repeat protein
MPLYAQSSREDGRSSWGILGGLLGGGSDGKRNYLRLFYLKIPTSAAVPSPAAAKEAGERRHATLALNYLRHGRHDRAAIEFALAGKAFEGDRDMQLAAGDAYLNARADEFGKELRSSVPSSLDPVFGGARGNMATVRTRLRRLAVQCFENALRLGADKPVTLRKLAEAQADLDNLPKALQFLTESDRLQPAFATGMERLSVAGTLWQRSLSQGKQNPQAVKDTREAFLAVLAELKARYPRSPTLALREAGSMGADWTGRFFYSAVAPREPFSPESQQCLALCRQGADWTPGAEEQAWLAGRRIRSEMTSRLGMAFGSNEDRLRPQTACARHAVAILNRQLQQLMAEKKYDEAAKLQDPVLDLLPRICSRCTVPDDPARSTYDYDLTAVLQQLRGLYVDAWKKPEAYLAMVEAFAAKTCRHQQAAVEQTIESMRLEQQYVKTWHVTGTIGGAKVDRQYAGGFFERYVDLDKILGKPDRCTVTAECVIRSPTERQAVLRLGFDHTLTAELNGQTILGQISRKIPVRDEFPVPITLKAGENRLRLTVTDDTLAYGFFARLSALDGTWMRDVTVSH